MSVANLWPLSFLILVPVIVLLYILKQKGTDEEVGSVMLWQETMKNTEATTPWEKYKHNILMYLQILTVLLLAFALMAPFLKQGGRDFSQVVLVLDNSASMNALYDGERTRFEESKERAVDYIDSLNENCAITLMTAANGGEILLSNATDKQAVKNAVKELSCTELAGTLEDCKNMVESVCAQWEKYGVIMFTDAPVVLNQLEATVVNLATEGENMAVNYVSYGSNDDGSLIVLAKISNFGKAEGTREVNLYGDDKLLDVQKITVPAGDSAVVYFENISFDGLLLRAEINEKDMLPNDNTSGVIVNAGVSKRVLLVTGGNTFLEKALGTMTTLDVYKTTDMAVVGKNETFDLYIFDNMMPETVPETGNIIYINPENMVSTLGKETGETKGELSRSEDSVEVTGSKEGVSLSFVNSELSQYLQNSSFGVNYARIFKRPVWANAFLMHGEDCCGYYGENGLRKVVCLGFDIHDTDLALSADFPVMIYNIMNYALESSLVESASYMTGDKVTLYSRGHDSDMTITLPDDSEVVIEAALTSKVFTDVDYTGLYTVSQRLGEETVSNAFYAGFPVESESGQEAGSSVDGATVGSDEAPSGGRDLRNIVIALLTLLLFVEWTIYVREY